MAASTQRMTIAAIVELADLSENMDLSRLEKDKVSTTLIERYEKAFKILSK